MYSAIWISLDSLSVSSSYLLTIVNKCGNFFPVEAEDVKRLGSAINILSTEKLKAQKVSHTMLREIANC